MGVIALRSKSKKKTSENQLTRLWLPMVLFIVIATLIVGDIGADLATGATGLHIVLECLLMLASAVGAFYFWRQLRLAQLAQKNLKRDLKKARAETTRWQEEARDLLHHLRKEINKQFTQWDFAPAEKEIAFYLLKGASLKEIAKLRGSTFNSVRQQAHVLYHKAGLGGRAELSAYFLGELLRPDIDSDEATESHRTVNQA
jgi:DNA-binding CsgD family transcriptional regulator